MKREFELPVTIRSSFSFATLENTPRQRFVLKSYRSFEMTFRTALSQLPLRLVFERIDGLYALSHPFDEIRAVAVMKVFGDMTTTVTLSGVTHQLSWYMERLSQPQPQAQIDPYGPTEWLCPRLTRVEIDSCTCTEDQFAAVVKMIRARIAAARDQGSSGLNAPQPPLAIASVMIRRTEEVAEGAVTELRGLLGARNVLWDRNATLEERS